MAVQTATDRIAITVTSSVGTQVATDRIAITVAGGPVQTATDRVAVTVTGLRYASYRWNGATWDKVTRWMWDGTTWQLVAGVPPAWFMNPTPTTTGGYPGPYRGPYPPPAGGPQPV